MAKISEQTIEQIRSTADIIDVVSGYVELKKRGRNYFGVCPFHDEKTPSFSVSQERQIYKCFGCGVGGGSINFIMEIENLEFVDALKHLADQYNIELEIDSASGISRDLTTQLLDIHEKTAHHYLKNLGTEEGQVVLKHLLERGLTKDTIRKFKIGYSVDSFDTLKQKLQQENYSSQALTQCGLILSNDRGYIDRFRGRIMFSIANASGKIIAFAGRVFQKDDPAKYVNSPETPIYNKSKILYGLWASKEAIRKTESVIVVEGYLDFLQLYQHGIENVVAVSGTAFTDEHAKLIGRHCSKAYLAYDGDTAGIGAAVRAGYILLKHGLDASVINIPEGMDPDDWVKNEGTEPFKLAIKNSEEFLNFHIQHTKHDLNSPSGMSAFIQRVVSELAQISNPVLRELQMKSLATKTKVSEENIFQTLNNLLQQIQRRQSYSKQRETQMNDEKVEEKSTLIRVEDELVQLCFSEDVKVRKYIYENLKDEWLVSSSTKEIYNLIYIHLHSEKLPSASLIIDEIKDKNLRNKLTTLIFDVENIDTSMSMVTQCLKRLELNWIDNRINDLREKLKVGGGSHDIDVDLIKEITDLQAQQHATKKMVQNFG